MKEYNKKRNNILNSINLSISLLNENNFISDKTYKKYTNRKFYLKKDAFKILSEFDNNYYHYTNDNSDKINIIKYGKSQLGRDLIAFVINDTDDYDNTIFITGAVHGFEGKYDNDGEELYNALIDVVAYYSDKDLVNTRLIIVPMCNPDGVYDGKSSVGFGRCTFNGIDINRDFMDYKYEAIESVYLKKLIDKYKPNMYIDIHGWLNSLYGDLDIIEPFYNNALVERKYPNQWGEKKGYIMGYTHSKLDCKSALIEFPDPKLISAGRIISAINEIIYKDDLDINAKIAGNLSKKFSDLRNYDKDYVKKIIRRKRDNK